MKIIAFMLVRNEAWIIERTLTALSAFCDHIIVADQRSTDGTPPILQKFAPRVVVVDNPSPVFSERARWALLDLAREYEGNNLLLCPDADELFSANILEENHLDRFAALPLGAVVSLEWVVLWRSPRFWRKDASVHTGQWKPVVFRDDRLARYQPENITEMHERRLPLGSQELRWHDLKLLHFQFVLWQRDRSKQCWYRVLETIKGGVSEATRINFFYRVTRDEREVHLSPLDPKWVSGWQKRGIDLEHFQEKPLWWFDVEVLRYFHQKGVAYFAPLDIWDLDWEAKRQLAISGGYDGLPAAPISDPRNWEQKLYHAYLARFQRHPFWRPREPFRLAKNLAWKLGLRREHLERLGILKPMND